MPCVSTQSLFFFFFSSRRRHTRFDCDWSSDVCSSDLVILEEFQRPLDVCGLLSLVAAAEKQYTFPPDRRVIDTVARSPIDPQLVQSLAQRFAVTKISAAKPVGSGPQSSPWRGHPPWNPTVEAFFSGAVAVVTNPNNVFSCNQ